MLTAQEITFIHPDKDLLFENISFSVQKQEKVALIGNNGSGKSTLLKIIAGMLLPAQGVVKSESKPYYVPQHYGQYNSRTIAEALQIADKLHALHAILQGDLSDKNMTILDDDWTIEDRCMAAMSHWELKDLSLDEKM
ncbi:MAG TPA: ATP-binding cassette domain-containing protein, partial [Bacteroidales bacterium]